MDYKKLLGAGIIYYAIIYLAASILMFTFKIEGMMIAALLTIVSIVTLYLIADKYYFTKKPKNYLKEGLIFGIGVSIISFVIEAVTMVYGVASDVGWAWYTQNGMMYTLIVGYIIVLIVSVFVAKRK